MLLFSVCVNVLILCTVTVLRLFINCVSYLYSNCVTVVMLAVVIKSKYFPLGSLMCQDAIRCLLSIKEPMICLRIQYTDSNYLLFYI